MRLNPIKITLSYLIFCAIWFLLTIVTLFLFRDKINPDIVYWIVTIRPYTFALINAFIIFKIIIVNNKNIADKESDYQNLYLSNPNPLWIYDPESLRFLSVNNAALASYGYLKDEFLSMGVQEICPDEFQEPAALSSQKDDGPDHLSGVWRHQKKDGTFFYVNVTAHNIVFKHRNAIMVLATDTTEQVKHELGLKQMNAVLEEEKQKLKATEKLAKLSGWEYFMADGDLVWSDELYEIFGFDKQAKVDYVKLLKCVHPEDLSAYNVAIENLLKYGRDLDITYRFITKCNLTKYVKILGKMTELDGRFFKAHGTMQDITELKVAQIENNSYQQRLKSTLNNIADGYFLINRDLVITSVNNNFEKLTGLKREEVLDHRYQGLFPRSETPKFYESFKKVVDKNLPVNFEEIVPGLQKWFCINMYPTDEGVAVFFSDITDNKEKDFKLAQALERYDLVAKATNDVIYDYEVVNNKTVYGQNIFDLLNLSLSDVHDFSTQWWKDRLHPDDLEAVLAKYRYAIMHKDTNCGIEYRMRTEDGEYKYVYDQGYLEYDKNRKFVRMTGALKDIDQVKRISIENKRLGDIMTKVNNIIVVQDANHGITWVNEAFENFTGYTFSEVKGKLPHQVLNGPETDLDVTKCILERKLNNEQFSYEIINYTRNGQKYWVQIDFTPLFTAQGKADGYICIYTNITLIKDHAEKINRQNEVLRNIAWMSSHELRKPVASILGLIELVNETDNEEDRNTSIKMMYKCTQHLDEIIRKINHRIENGLSEGQSVKSLL